jgi:small subunit ribosomal protein S3
MGQKVNPHGFRVGVIKDWDSRWFAKDNLFGDILVEDYNLRNYLKKTLFTAGVPRIEIERDASRVRINIHCAKPGMVIGKGGTEIDKLRRKCEEMLGKPVSINIVEVRSPDIDAQLVAENIAAAAREAYVLPPLHEAGHRPRHEARRQGHQDAGVAGRLGGAEIARKEHYHEGTIPLQTLRADIDYGFTEAKTTYGRIGVKVWIYKGEILSGRNRRPVRKEESK